MSKDSVSRDLENKRKVHDEQNQSEKKRIHKNCSDDYTDSFLCHAFHNFIPVLSHEYSIVMDTELMFVGKVNIKKETSRLIKELSQYWTLKPFIKRVRWTAQKDVFEILIRPVKENENIDISKEYPLEYVLCESNINSTGLMSTAFICKIPKYPALTSKQFTDSLKFWPVQFREDKYVEKVISDKLFSTEEKYMMTNFMHQCLRVAEYGDVKVGCVVVDSTSSEVIAVAHDCRDNHPLQHAVMVAVDLVAKSQNGGSWKIKSQHLYYKPFIKEEYDQKIDELRKSNPEKNVAKLYTPYLCTSYDLYITREPCAMCAMALVHSRIRRVFYGCKTRNGALGSCQNLHLQSGLNHHFEVWKGLLENECAKLEA